VTVALAVSRVALGMALTALFLTMAASRIGRRPNLVRRWIVMAVATLALGMGLFALFFGLVTGCDRL
jgi:hypothetical protein